MGVVKNKAVAQAMVRALADGAFPDDVVWNDGFWGWTLTSGDITKAQFLHRVGLFGGVFKDRAEIRIDTVTGEDDRVFVQFRVIGELITGEFYRQNAAFMVEFDETGAVRHWREYFDARIVAELLFPAMKLLDERRGTT